MIVIPHMVERDATVLFDECSELPKDVTMALLTITNPNKDNRNEFSYEDYNVVFDFRRLSFMFATTEGQSIFHALMDRMERIDLEEYKLDELGKIVMMGLKGYTVVPKTLEEISSVLRGNARAGQKMAMKMKLYLDAKGITRFDAKGWKDLCGKLGILPLGISIQELNLMRYMARKKATRLTELSAITGLSKGAIQKDYELYLSKMGLMEIQPEGRSLTTKGLEYLNELDGVKKDKSDKRRKK